ncbi:MAG: hypothetical protein HYT06_02050 [Candidatus Levybacteria bacterium]|nr:hypothetical protein [Candidatus Levybacteria bacterium]
MDSKKRILETLSYFNFFNYPLTKEEIWQFTKTDKTKEHFFKYLKTLNISSYKSFYYLKNRKDVDQRLEKEKISSQKIIKALPIIKKLSFLPTVEFIGISGSLAMKNSSLDEDIDIFVISKNNLTWFTRLMLVLLLSLFGVYRKKRQVNTKDKICLNLIIGKESIGFIKKRQSIYIAHEIVQLLPVFQRQNCYFDFLNQNDWVFNFFPNIKTRIKDYKIFFNAEDNFFNKILVWFLNITRVEKFARILQWEYMKNDVTIETVEDNFLAFHPQNTEKKVNVFLKRNA